MPAHKQVTECRRGGPVSNFCSCEHCTLGVCSVCNAYEGSLTTDCPGEGVSGDRQQEIYTTNLDYTDARGWHQGEPEGRRSPRFEKRAEQRVPKALPSEVRAHAPLFAGSPMFVRIAGCSCGWRTPPSASDDDEAFTQHAAAVHAATAPVDPRSIVSPTTDWAAIDRTTDLKHELSQKAIAWVLADRVCDDHSAGLTRVEDEVDAYMRPRKGQAPDMRARELLEKLEYAKAGFKLADQRAVKCDEEFRQAARKLVAELEKSPTTVLTMDAEVVGERGDPKER